MRVTYVQVSTIVIVSYEQVFAAFKRYYTWKTTQDDESLKKNQWVRTTSVTTSPLIDKVWDNIVLDEAHRIKNDYSGRAIACYKLQCSGLRLCLTGTPIQNSLDDFWSLIKFLRLPDMQKRRDWTSRIIPCGYVKFDALYDIMDRCVRVPAVFFVWITFVSNPSRLFCAPYTICRLNMCHISEYYYGELIQMYIFIYSVMLRRRKDTRLENGAQLMTLPPVTRVVKAIPLMPLQQVVMAAIRDMSLAEAHRAKQKRKRMEINELEYHAILLQMFRLLQMVGNHAILPLHGKIDNASELHSLFRKLQVVAEGLAHDTVGATTTTTTTLAVDDDNDDVEPIVIVDDDDEVDHDVKGTAMSHNNNHNHMSNAAALSSPHPSAQDVPPSSEGKMHAMTMSMWKQNKVTFEQVQRILQRETLTKDRINLTQLSPVWDCASNKMTALLRDVHEILTASPANKIVIFSQFVQMLNLFVASLKTSCWPQYCHMLVRIDGQTTSEKRVEAIQQFTMLDTTRIMIASLGAGGVGLNLQAANHVILLDLWWNVAMEQQALERVYRYGQERPVTMITYYSPDSIESRILAYQQRKKLVGNHALRESVALAMDDETATLVMNNKGGGMTTEVLENMLAMS